MGITKLTTEEERQEAIEILGSYTFEPEEPSEPEEPKGPEGEIAST